MNKPLAVSLAILLLTSSITAQATEIPRPERKPFAYAEFINEAEPPESEYTQIAYNAPENERTRAAPKAENTAQEATAAEEQPPQQIIDIPLDMKVSKLGDTDLSCPDLYDEATHMRDIIYVLEDEKTNSSIKSGGVKAAGAVGSLLIGTATGGVGLALGGFLLDQNIKQDREEADSIQDIAEQRRTLMMGIFNAKGCDGPIQNAMQNPEKFDPIDMIANIEPASGAQYQSKLRRRYND